MPRQRGWGSTHRRQGWGGVSSRSNGNYSYNGRRRKYHTWGQRRLLPIHYFRGYLCFLSFPTRVKFFPTLNFLRCLLPSSFQYVRGPIRGIPHGIVWPSLRRRRYSYGSPSTNGSLWYRRTFSPPFSVLSDASFNVPFSGGLFLELSRVPRAFLYMPLVVGQSPSVQFSIVS